MGDTGQGTSNGGGGGTTRASAGPANLSMMQALAQKSGNNADTLLAEMLVDATSKTKVKVDKDQQNTDTQRYWNATGLADKKPVVVNTEHDLEVQKFSGDVHGQYFYHTDAPTSPTPDAKTYATQYQTGRQYVSAGAHGDGTYWSNNERDSWQYGYHDKKSYQIKGMLNSNAKVIKETDLMKRIASFKRSHPKASKAVEKMSSGWGSSNGLKSIYASLFGYNVIQSLQAGHDYLTVIDRSATTVVKKGWHYSELAFRSSGTVWDYK